MRIRTRGTGSIFKPKNSRFYWIAYHSGGKRHFESTESTRKGDAQDRLTLRLGDIAHGIAVTPKIGKLMLGVGLQRFIDNLRMNGRKSGGTEEKKGDADRKTKRLLDYFGPDCRMAMILGGDIEAYKAHRLNANAARATVNRELAALRRAYRLALKRGDLLTMPSIELLSEDNARQGFLERHEFDAIVEQLSVDLRPPVRFAYFTGWRFTSEILSLQLSRVDLTSGTITIAPGETKDKKGRTFYFSDALPELRDVLAKQVKSIEAFERKGKIVRHIFHRANGQPIRNMRGAWKTACVAAGYPGKLFHDFRRTAVRNLERAGAPRSMAMKMIGHRTETIYRRYAIEDEKMGQETIAKLGAWSEAQRIEAQRTGRKRRGQLKAFARAVGES
jgi:integrase